MKNVLVIGGNGFIGSNIVNELLNNGYRVSILDLPNSDRPRLNIKTYYGSTIYGVNKKEGFSESDNTEPISYYGQSKLILEESIMLEGRRQGLNYLILRPSNPYGMGQNIYGKQGLIAACIGHILKSEKITIWGDGSVIRDYIHINDLSNGVVKLIENGVNNQIYNIGSGRGYSVNEIIRILKKSLGIEFRVEYLDARAVDVPVMVLDVKKIQFIIGDTNVSIEQGIIDFYNYEAMNNEEMKPSMPIQKRF